MKSSSDTSSLDSGETPRISSRENHGSAPTTLTPDPLKGCHINGFNGVSLMMLRDVTLTARVSIGREGDYPWDRWEMAARQIGVTEPLVQHGRTVFAMAYEEYWSPALCWECGWSPFDGGAEMIRLALAYPEKALARWAWLIETNGLTRAAPRMIPVDPISYDHEDMVRRFKVAARRILAAQSLH